MGPYNKLDSAIIADVSRRIVKTEGVTPTAAHQIDKALPSEMLIADITKQIAVVPELSLKNRFIRDKATNHNKQNAPKTSVFSGVFLYFAV